MPVTEKARSEVPMASTRLTIRRIKLYNEVSEKIIKEKGGRH
jgi:hypothetical protein